jgi:hypothetical protein
LTIDSRDSSPSSSVRSRPNVSSGLVSAASVAAYDPATFGPRAVAPLPMPIALAFTSAGRFAIALARPGSIADRAPRSVTADCRDSI